jgi:hypothetical protein
MAARRKAAASVGMFPTDGPLFVGLLPGVIVILYLLQYFPALALGLRSGISRCSPARLCEEPANMSTLKLFDSAILGCATLDALAKLDRRQLAKNPLILVPV